MADQSKQNSTDSKKPFTVSLFLIKTILWLFPAFFFWYIGAKLFCYPAIFLADTILPHLLPTIVSGLHHLGGGGADVITNVQMTQEGRTGLISFSINTLKYAYGFPLLFAMTMATNRSGYDKMDSLTYGFVIIILAQTWSICFEVLSTLLLKGSNEQFEQITQAAPFYTDTFVLNSIALGYQLGFLILPAVVPIIFWVLRHQSFLSTIAMDKMSQKTT